MVNPNTFDKLNKLNSYGKKFVTIQKSVEQSGYFQFIKNVQENIKKFEDSGIFTFFNQVQNDLKNVEKSNVYSTIKYISEISQRFENLSLSKSVEQIQGVSKSINQFLEKNKNIAQTMNAFANRIEKNISAINKSLLKSKENFSNFSQLVDNPTLGVKLVDIINNLKNYDHIDYVLNDLNETIALESTKQKPNYLTYRTYESFIYFILTIIVTVFFNRSPNDKLIEYISNSEKKLIEQIKNLKPIDTNLQTLYIVTSKLNVRSGTSTSNLIIDKLYPNQELIVHKISDKWCYVEYYDFINDVPKTGWVYKRYIKQVNNK